jgi:hypothetical protein
MEGKAESFQNMLALQQAELIPFSPFAIVQIINTLYGILHSSFIPALFRMRKKSSISFGKILVQENYTRARIGKVFNFFALLGPK